jgi:Protein of unknown function (DUF4232)
MLLARRALLLVVLLGSTAAVAAAQTPPCRFVLGFATLDGLIPDVVGNCVANESTNPANGDSLQFTTNGLLVWRKSDNFTAFTDGTQTWVIGPLGLQQRADDQRFAWEPNPERLAIIPPPVAGDRCHTSGLALAVNGVDVGAGNLVGTFSFTNELDVSCTFFGFPGAELRDPVDNPLPTNVVRGGGPFTDNPPPAMVTVPAHGTARFLVHWEQVPVGGETSCPVSTSLTVTPPDEFVPLLVPVAIRACGGGRLDMSAVQPAA